MKIGLFLIPFLFGLLSIAQNATMYRTIYGPAEPYGGEDGVKDLIKQAMIYPEKALAENVSAEVFVSFIINNEGVVTLKKISGSTDSSFIKEADRLFNLIVWVADDKRDNDELGLEKLGIIFKPNKYKKLIKKRGYEQLPGIENPDKINPEVFDINHVDEKPEYSNINNLNSFLKENFKYPAIALQQNLSGRVTVRFIIEPYGMASNIQVVEPVGGGCNDETIRLVKLMRWKPAKKDGKKVRCESEYQLNFVNPGSTIR